MILVALFLLTACSEAISGNHPKLVEANRPNSKDSILDTCQVLLEDAQEMREEGYSAINRADIIREQAYRVKDEAYVIKESALLEKSGLEIFLVETLALMKNQATANNLYIQEIRASLSSVLTRMESLELGLEDVEQGQEQLEEMIGGKISELTELVSQNLATSGEHIPAVRVSESTTYHNTNPETAVDGNVGTASHTECEHPRPWFRYYFSGQRAVGQIKVINGKLNENRIRLNGVKVAVMAGNGSKRPCAVDTITVREGEFVEAQTYYLDCTGNTGVGVEFALETTTCLEFREIEVYAP